MAINKMIKVYECEKCGHEYSFEHVAETCCKQYYCDTCGAETAKYMHRCENCREREIFEKAEKISVEEYEQRYPSHMIFCEERYFEDINELIEYYSDSDETIPEYCYGTTCHYMKLDVDEIISSMIQEADCKDINNIDDRGYMELNEFANVWNNKYQEDYYYIDETIAIIIPNELCKNQPSRE